MSGKKQLKKLRRDIEELLFPPRCAVCKSFEGVAAEALCESCLADVSYMGSPQCTVCGREFSSRRIVDHVCEQCLRQAPPFALARSITFYEEPVRSLLHNLKYRFDTSSTTPLFKIAQSFDFSPFENCDVILPVPLYINKLKQRGMNQALILARLFFADRKGKINVGILRRIRPTISQTELDARGRKNNLRAAFLVQGCEIIQNKVVCLIDDVYTTGGTVTECARAIKMAGAAEVRVLTMARVRQFI